MSVYLAEWSSLALDVYLAQSLAKPAAHLTEALAGHKSNPIEAGRDRPPRASLLARTQLMLVPDRLHPGSCESA